MHHFAYRNGRLYAEDVDLTVLADAVGTPAYVYSEATLRRHFCVFRDAFKGVDTLVAYSVKANSNIAVLGLLASEGGGADVVSGGEMNRALAAGIAPEKIVFSGVGKTRAEIAAAVEAGIFQFNVESAAELEAINEIALAAGSPAPVALRINPDVAAGGHDKISTGKKTDKFGVPWDEARGLYAKAREMKGVVVRGVDVHIGSQIDALEPFEAAFRKVAELIGELRADGCAILTLDLGGGLGIPYGEGAIPPHPEEYAKMIMALMAPLGVRLIFEPGRMIAGNAGILLSRVLYAKETDGKRFLIIDAGMNDLVRPAMYDAFHEIWPLEENTGETAPYDVVGPVCESSDRFAKDRQLPPMKPGDLVAIMSAGAYGASQSSQYNSRPLVPEILVSGDDYKVIRRRPSFEEMIALERI